MAMIVNLISREILRREIMSKLIIVVASMGVIGFLFLGLTWGEGLLHREWISRFDYLIILFSGLASAMCLSILLFVRVES